jgi:ABC-2 type transport system ATP-binding protein
VSSAAVTVREVTKTYRDGGVVANDRVDLDVAPGQIFGLLGPNGAGKSTLVRQLVGLTRPDRGRIELFGYDVIAARDVAGHLVAYLGQDESALLDLPVRAAVATTARLRGLGRRASVAEADDLVDELGLGAIATRPLARLSGGQRRLACVASSLAAQRPLLLLDEPTAGLDPVARREVWAAVTRRRDAGVTVVLVTHNVLEAEAVLDQVAILDRGRVIACDTPGRLKAAVSDDVRLELVWRLDPPLTEPTVADLARVAVVSGRRWTVRLAPDEARAALGRLTTGAAFASLDDFTLATPSLEDVYLLLGGRDDDLERA